MTESSTIAPAAASAESLSPDHRVWTPTCPPGCWRVDEPATHEFDYDGADGQTYVVHEVHFGEYVYGSVHEFVLVARREATVTIDVDALKGGGTADPAVVSDIAASAMSAAAWLEARP